MLKSRPARIVFIGHEATLTGAPILLLNLLLLLKRHGVAEITLVLRRGGALLPAYEEHFPVTVLKPVGYGKGQNLMQQFSGIVQNRLKLLQLMAKVKASDLVFSNTVVNGRLLNTLSYCRKPIVAYIHELDEVLKLYIASGDATGTFRHSKLLAYPSAKVRHTLHELCQVPEQRLCELSYFFPAERALIENKEQRDTFAARFRERYQIPPGCLLIGGMGTISRRKGIDLFMSICQLVTAENDQVRFCWIGSFEDAATEQMVQQLLVELELGDRLIFSGRLPHHYFNTAAFDLFLLSSREDPYPLVVIEAALMGVPALCFEAAGGITEFVNDDAGWIIPGYSATEAARMLLQLAEDRALIRERGSVARQRALQRHCNETRILDQFRSLLNQIN